MAVVALLRPRRLASCGKNGACMAVQQPARTLLAEKQASRRHWERLREVDEAAEGSSLVREGSLGVQRGRSDVIETLDL